MPRMSAINNTRKYFSHANVCTPKNSHKMFACFAFLIYKYDIYMGLVIRRKIVIFILIWVSLFIGEGQGTVLILCK